MADTETLIFRIRAMAENLDSFAKAARASGQVNDSMKAASQLSETLRKADQKLTVARDRQADAQGRVRVAEEKLSVARDRQTAAVAKVRAAEQKANDVRSNAKATLTQIAAAEQRVTGARISSSSATSQVVAEEERLLSARRSASRASSDLQRIEEEFRTTATRALGDDAENSGKNSGKRWGAGFLSWMKGEGKKAIGDGSEGSGDESGHRFTAGFLKRIRKETGNFATGAEIIGRSFGSGVGSGLEAAMKSEAGPIIIGVLLAAVAAALPAIGAVLAGGIVATFGAGIAALPIVFAAKAQAVKLKWHNTLAQMGADMQLLSQPFQAVLIHMADTLKSVFDKFNPTLRSIFQRSAGPVQTFADQAIHALDGLLPVIGPISTAFDEMLKSLGPALQASIKSLAEGLKSVADSVAKNPTALPDFVAGVFDLTNELFKIIGILNDTDGAFKRMTGGISLVTVTMSGLKALLDTIATPFVIFGATIQGLSTIVTSFGDSMDASGQSMSNAANHTVDLLNGLKATRSAASGVIGPLSSVHEVADSNAKAAAAASKAFEDWITQLFKVQNLALGTAGAQVNLKQAILDATAAITGGSSKVEAARNKELTATGKVKVAEAQLAQLRSSGKATGAQILAAEEKLSAAKRTAKLASEGLTAAEKANTKGIDLNTQHGVDLYRSLLNVASASNDVTEKLIRQKAPMSAVITTAQQQKAAFIKLAEEMGFNSKQAEAMARKMIAIPNVKRSAKLDANTAALTRKVAAAQKQIDHMHGVVVPITYTVDGVNFTLNTKNPSSVGRSATGGKINGPGTGTSDTAGLWALSNDEWVIRAKASQKYGDYAMQSVNDGTATIIPGMAKGGKTTPVDIHGYGVFKDVAQLRKVLGASLPATSAPGAGAGVQKWRAVALAALAAAHEPASWIGSLLSRMQRESGGNPRAINLTDVNAQRGDPSRGLMQTIGSTFNAYAGPYRSRGIYDPFANIYAAIKYTVARYGSGPAGWNKAGGYKNGGWLQPGQLAYNETSKPEAVFNQHQLGSLTSQSSQDSQVMQKVQLEFKSDGSPYMEFLMREFRKYVRIHGGDVQKVLGQNG